MALLPAIEASAPSLSLTGHVNYGHIITLIVYLIRINVATGRWTGLILFGIQKLYISMPHRVCPGFIIWLALATVMCRVLIHIIVIMGLWHSVGRITGIFLLPYFLQHLCQPVLVPALHVQDQVFVVFLEPCIEAILLHHFQLTRPKQSP